MSERFRGGLIPAPSEEGEPIEKSNYQEDAPNDIYSNTLRACQELCSSPINLSAGHFSEVMSRVKDGERILGEAISDPAKAVNTLRNLRYMTKKRFSGGWFSKQAAESQTMQVRTLAENIIANNLKQLQKWVQTADYSKLDDSIRVEESLAAIHILAKSEDRPKRQQAFEFWQEAKHTLKKDLTTHELTPAAREYVMLPHLLMEKGTPEQQVVVIEDIVELLRDENTIVSARGYDALSRILGSEDQAVHDIGMKVVRSQIESVGLNPDNFLDDWKKSCSDKNASSCITLNVKAITRLEKRKPGLVKALSEDKIFQIKNFARYPAEVLERQYEERNDAEKPYGIALYPRNDDTGAFYRHNHVLQQLQEQIGDSHALRIIETDGRLGAAKTAVALSKRYGKDTKIQFGIIAGHGNPETITLGDDEKYGQIKNTDFSGTGSSRLGEFFSADATIMLLSCSTGVEKASRRKSGIAKAMSASFKRTVIAPDHPGWPSSIKVDTDNTEGLQFTVEYNYRTDGAQKYVQGERSQSAK